MKRKQHKVAKGRGGSVSKWARKATIKSGQAGAARKLGGPRLGLRAAASHTMVAPLRRPVRTLGAIGASPSGKAADFDSAIRRFESSRPSQVKALIGISKPFCSR